MAPRKTPSTSNRRATATARKVTPTPQRVLAVLGNDEMAVKKRATELAAAHTPADSGDMGVEIHDGMVDNSEQAGSLIAAVLRDLATPPFFGTSKLVWIKNASFLEDSVVGRAESVAEALADLRQALESGLPEGVMLLLSAPGADRRKAFTKSLPTFATVEAFDKPSAGRPGEEGMAAEQMAVAAARELGLRFSRGALPLFAAMVVADPRQIAGEVAKLDTYLGAERREITEEDVTLLVPETRQGVIFTLGNRMAERDLPASVACLRKLLQQGENPIGLLYAAILPTLRNLLTGALLVRQGLVRAEGSTAAFTTALANLAPDWQAILPRRKDGTVNAYGLQTACRQAGKFAVEELAAALPACAQANLQLVSTGHDPALVLEQFLVRFLGRSAPKAKNLR